MAKSFNVRGYPTFVLVNSKTKTLHRWIGYERDSFIESLKAGLEDPTTIKEKISRFETEPDVSTADALANYYDSQGEYSKAVKYYEDAVKLNSDASKNYAYDIFQCYYYGFRRDQFSLDKLINSAKNALSANNLQQAQTCRLYYYMSNLIVKEKDNKDMLQFIKDGHKYYTKIENEDFQTEKDNINILYIIYIENKPKQGVKLKKESMPEGWQENAGDLNAFSWWCFEHKVNLDEAEKLARKGAELAEPGNEKAMILDTVAEIVNLKGNPQEAVKLTEQAIKESPNRKYYKDQLLRFKKLTD
ncbi:MAG: tetratricopeptide repeat protein [Calditrichaceae bacterium]